MTTFTNTYGLEYKYTYKATLAAVQELAEKYQKHGYMIRITKKRDDLYELRTYMPEQF